MPRGRNPAHEIYVNTLLISIYKYFYLKYHTWNTASKETLCLICGGQRTRSVTVGLEQFFLFAAGLQPELLVAAVGRDAPLRRSLEVAFLDQERLIDFLDSSRIF